MRGVERFGRTGIAAAMLVAIVMGASGRAQAQDDEPPLGFSNNAELSLVMTSGNAKANTVGLRNVYMYRWTPARLSWESGWVRAASRDGKRYAVLRSDGGFDVIEPGTAIDSQRLFSKLRYERRISGRYDWFSSVDAMRDEPANINGQAVLAGGFGTTWKDEERLSFRTLYGVTYTREDLAVEGVRRFGGYRLFYGLKTLPTATTTIESELTADGSFDQRRDVRADWLNGVSVAVNSNVALKGSFRLLYRNVPALEKIDLRLPGVSLVLGKVEIPKRKLDTTFTTSLVLKF